MSWLPQIYFFLMMLVAGLLSFGFHLLGTTVKGLAKEEGLPEWAAYSVLALALLLWPVTLVLAIWAETKK